VPPLAAAVVVAASPPLAAAVVVAASPPLAAAVVVVVVAASSSLSLLHALATNAMTASTANSLTNLL
jgi:hypothetical protein